MQHLLDLAWISISWQGVLLTALVFVAMAGMDAVSKRRRGSWWR